MSVCVFVSVVIFVDIISNKMVRIRLANLKEIDTVTQVQVLDKVVRISHSAHALGKGMHQTIFPPAMDNSRVL